MSTNTSADKCSKYKCRTEMYRDPIALDGTIPYDLDKIPMRRRRHVKREAISPHKTKLNHSELSTIVDPSQTFILGDISIEPDGEDEGWIYQHTLKHEHAYQQLDDKMKVFAVAGWDDSKKTLQRSLPVLINICQGSTDKRPEEYSKLIKVLASPSPVCGTFHYTFIDLLEKILEQEKITLPLMKVLQEHCPMLFDMLQTRDGVPSFLKTALREVICKVKTTFEGHKGQDTGLPIGPASRDAFYPALPEVCKRGKYQLDGKKWEVPFCIKKHGRHPILLPGIFTVFCQNGICYGYQIMKLMESPNIPFTFLKTRFEVAPEAVIYDNACNLHAYCLNRDPVFFARTQFAVDALHWFNHTGCSIGYESELYPMFKSVNTQIVEQNNYKLKKLKSSLLYMTPHNFHVSLRFFLWNCNREMKTHN